MISEEEVYIARNSASLRHNETRPKIIDLFSGAGGLTLGFTEKFGHDFEPVWANDINDWAVATYNANFGDHCIAGDLQTILSKPDRKPPKADVVLGGPPCQGFSLLNKNRNCDPRKQLWLPFMQMVEKVDADIFVMENVPQLLGSSEYQLLEEASKSLGFEIASAKLCAADYGVPQTRWRAFVMGCRFADPKRVFPPKRTNYDFNNGGVDFINYVSSPLPWRTVRDAIIDLPSPIGTEITNGGPPLDLHFRRSPTSLSIKRYRTIPEEGMNRFDLQRLAPELTPKCWIRKKTGGTDLFGRLWWNRPAFTIRTEFFKPEKGRYLHPSQHRPITHREAARLQTFPDSFVFKGNKTEIAKQIGNAVPPVLASRIADCVYALLSER